MTAQDIAHHRLANLQIAHTISRSTGEVVAALGAMQAQDYPGALWAVGLRLRDARLTDVEQAIAERKIVRTWPMRGTLHFVAAPDVRWMLQLMTPRIITGSAARQRNLGLDAEVFARSKELLVDALQGGKILTRNEMCAVLERGNISTAGQRGIHIFWRLSQEGVLCFGPHDDKQPTFVLLDEWIPETKVIDRSEALGKLTKRYFESHGPATVQDLVRWSGLRVVDIKDGLEMVGSQLAHEDVKGQTYWMPKTIPDVSMSSGSFLLPGFDEYMLGYKDRSAALDPIHSEKIVPGSNGMFISTIIIDGQVRGTWKRIIKKNEVAITLYPFKRLTSAELRSITEPAEHYGQFLDKHVVVSVVS